MGLTKKEIKVFSIAAAGGGLEFYDFIVFALFSSVIAKLFFSPVNSDFINLVFTYIIFGVGYLARPFGGIVLGHLGDRYGREKIFLATIMIMAFSTLFIGIIPSYKSIGISAPVILLVLRICQGLALGGELPGGVTFIYEHMSKTFRGLGIAIFFSGALGGILLGSLIGTFIAKIFSTQEIISYAWRIPFVFGGTLAFVGVYIRRNVSETPEFLSMVSNNETLRFPILKLLKNHKLELLQGFSLVLFTAIVTMIFYIYIVPYALTYFSYKKTTIFALNTIALVCLIVFTIVAAYLSSIINEKKLFFIGLILILILSYPFYFAMSHHNHLLYLFISFIISFCTGLLLLYGFILPKLFDPNVRFSAISICLNISFVIAGFLPAASTILIKKLSTNFAPFIILAIAGIITLLININYFKQEKAGL